MMIAMVLAIAISAGPPGDGVPAKPPDAGVPDELARLREQIARDMEAVERKLRERDPGDGTQSLQRQIVENIEKLLKRLQEPPPDDDAAQSQQQPMSGQSKSQTKPQSSEPDRMTRRERREAQRRQQMARQPSPSRPTQPQPAGAQPNADPRMPTSRTTTRAAPAGFADVVKDIWGHLPESLRQDVDQYYRDQFMPRYRDLLQEYYRKLAETDQRPRRNSYDRD